MKFSSNVPASIKKYIGSLSAKAHRNRELTSYYELTSKFNSDQIVNALFFLIDHGIPPHGEVTRNPITFLADNQLLVEAYNLKPNRGTQSKKVGGPNGFKRKRPREQDASL